jgi:eukaryotic translation initiation factor 2C
VTCGPKRQHRARGVTRPGADACTFRNYDLGRNDNVAAYFNRKFPDAQLQYPRFPCVDVSKSASKPVWIPMEHCAVVAGQRRQLVDDPKASAEMIKQTTSKPDQRWRHIEGTVRDHVAGDATLAAFGVGVSANTKALQGRVLPAPDLEYGGGARVKPAGGSWDLRSVRLLTPGRSPAAWAAVCCDHRQKEELDAFIPAFIDGVRRTAGVALPPAPARGAPRQRETLENMLLRVLRAAPAISFVLCVLDASGGKEAYERVKKLLDEQQGVVSQCMLPKHLGGGGGFGGAGGRGGRDAGGGGRGGGRGGGGGGGPNPQVIANIAQKVNAKLGGTNTAVAAAGAGAAGAVPRIAGISEVPTMLFGADVTHPAPGSGACSVAALVGSLDGGASRYAARLTVQPGGQETISALESMARELLREFERATRHKPERIIFFRDGVSEGQFQEILRTELPLLQAAFGALGDGSYRPKLTFIVVQKRHHTRLFVDDSRDADRSGNVPPGTVVDTAICHPHEHDFFMMSHAGIQGTSRPVHYHILLDENGYGADVLQGMVFKLCHLYCRCTRSVSLVPPVYYAHLAAFRGRVLRAAAEGSDAGSVSGGAAAAAGGGELNVHANLRQAMYFV